MNTLGGATCAGGVAYDPANRIAGRNADELLGSLISAQRATVTRALGWLSEDGQVTRRDDGLLVAATEGYALPT